MAQIRVCYKCENRKIGCHAICDKYISERKKNDEIIERRLAKKKVVDDVYLSRTSGKRYKCC